MTYARRGTKRRSDSLALWRHDEASACDLAVQTNPDRKAGAQRH
jgi:hypothetical protein